MDVRRWAMIEAISQVKARYFRFMDTKHWSDYRELFTDDMRFHADPEGPPTLRSGDEFVAFVRDRLTTATTVHQGHMGEVTLTSESTARGIWAMFDWVDDPDHGRAFQGWGHYHDVFRLEEGRWRIAELRLVRLRVDQLEPGQRQRVRSVPVLSASRPAAR
jgi:hypothetical protein